MAMKARGQSIGIWISKPQLAVYEVTSKAIKIKRMIKKL